MTPETIIGFNGGPMDDIDIEGIFAWVIAKEEPPFVCMFVDGRHEHYVRVTDCEAHPMCYEYAGACSELQRPHPPCGHDHTWADSH